MGRSKEKKHKLKENLSESSSPNKQGPKKLKNKESKNSVEEKPVGRQTNNSLASATGPILIQPGLNPHKKKLKTSQVFGQSDEDLQTGLHKILDFVKDHDDAWPFIDPVEEEYAPNYYTIIRKPMDLQKMEERLDAGYYKNFSKFKVDFELIVNNCRLYNGVDNEYTEMVDNLLEAFNRAVERYLDQTSSTDEEVAVEYPTSQRGRDTSRKRKSNEEPIKVKEKVNSVSRKRARSESEVSDTEKSPKKKKQNKKQKKFKTSKKEKEKENEKIKDDIEMKENKGVKRKSVDLGKKDKAKHNVSQSSKEKNQERTHLGNKEKNKKIKHAHLKKDVSSPKEKSVKKDEKKHRVSKLEKNDRHSNSLNKNKKTKKNSSINKRLGSSRSPDDWSDPSPSSHSDLSDYECKRSSKPVKGSKKSALFENEIKQPKKNNKDIDLFDDLKFGKKFEDDSPLNHKDKHNKLRETIEKLKAKSDLNKLSKLDKDLKVYDFPSENTDKSNTELSPIKKKRKFKDSQDENKKRKAKNDKKSDSSYDALSLATAETLKDINKWLDDTPRFSEFSSNSNSPMPVSSVDDVESIKSDVDLKKTEKSSTIRKDAQKDPTKKRSASKELVKAPRRKEIQRTIDRLQPGKSKGNLISSCQSNTKSDELFPLGTSISKIKDSKNSLIVKPSESAPKLSLGTVLDSFGQHKFIDDEEATPKVSNEKAEEEAVPEKKEVAKVEEPETETKAESATIDNSPGKATPNLSAWFKAFGGPKVQLAFKKCDSKEETPVEVKKEEVVDASKKVSLPDPSPTEIPTHGQPIPRQRRVSTGSSVSERSSFSQDMDSPRVGFDERLGGSYPAPYPSPLHKSPSGASPSLRSPLPDASPKGSQYPFNGQIRVGFYQDTVSTKSSPDKSCSPRDNPQSPYNQYSEHVYVPQTTQNLEYSYNNPYYQQTPNYPANNAYAGGSEKGSYYDTTKPLTDQYQAKANEHSATSPTSQKSDAILPQASPLDITQREHSPSVAEHPSPKDLNYQQNMARPPTSADLFPNPPSAGHENKFAYPNTAVPTTVAPTYRSNVLDYNRPSVVTTEEPFRSEVPLLKTQTSTFPVKKRAYNEIDQARYEDQFAPRPEPNRVPTTEEVPRSEPPTSRLLPTSQPIPSQNPVAAFPPASYNYPDSSLQYPAYNMSSSPDRTGTLEEVRKVDMSKYTNMGYQEPDANFSRQQYKVQDERFEGGSNNILNIGAYKPPGSQKSEVSVPKPTFSNPAGPLEADPNLAVRGNITNLSHIVDRFPNDERLLGLQANPPPPPYYSDKNLPPQHLFAKQSGSPLPMFPPTNAMPPYSHGMQPNSAVYSRPMASELQSLSARERSTPAQSASTPAAAAARPATEKKTKKRKTKASQQQQIEAQPPQSHSTSPHAQGFQSYAGFKSNPSLEPSAISLKTTSVVPGSAFNFGSTIGGGIYGAGDKETYPNYLDDYRSSPNYYMAAAAAAHHRATPEGSDKTNRMAQPPSNPTPGTTYSFIGAPQPRPPNYPLGAPFMPAHQAPLVEGGPPLYQQYLQGLLGPPGAYPPGYPALGIRQPYDSITRPSWL